MVSEMEYDDIIEDYVIEDNNSMEDMIISNFKYFEQDDNDVIEDDDIIEDDIIKDNNSMKDMFILNFKYFEQDDNDENNIEQEKINIDPYHKEKILYILLYLESIYGNGFNIENNYFENIDCDEIIETIKIRKTGVEINTVRIEVINNMLINIKNDISCLVDEVNYEQEFYYIKLKIEKFLYDINSFEGPIGASIGRINYITDLLTNARISKLYDIIEECLMYDEIRKKINNEKRNLNRQEKRKQNKKSTKKQNIIKLYNQCLTKKEIKSELNCTLQYINKIIKEVKCTSDIN